MHSESLDGSHSEESTGIAPRAGSWIVFLCQPKIAIPVIVILLLIAAPLVFRAIRLSRVPPADEPFDTKSVLTFVVPDADNAFVEYRAASALLVPRDSKVNYEEFEKAQSEGWEHATESVRKWLDANRPFMELWRKGSAKPDAQYCRASELRADTSLTKEIQEAREFSRLVRLEASRLIVEGKAEGAWDWLQTSFRMSRQLGRHGAIIERLVGIATHSLTHCRGHCEVGERSTSDSRPVASRDARTATRAKEDAAALRLPEVGISLRDGNLEVSDRRPSECNAESLHR